jgi:4-amino-4-deoxy-L-arabinose transferase-like glycosyltransferase
VTPSAIHPPGFTLWLSIASGIGFSSFFAHKVMSAIAGALAVFAIGMVARRLAGPGAALLAAALAALHPNLWVVEGILMPESLYALMIALVLWGAYRYLAEPTLGWVAVLGALIGLATLVRGEAVFLLVLLGAPMLLIAHRRRWLGQAALLGMAFTLVLAPWTIRNVIQMHHFVPISANSDEVIRNANCDQTYYGRQLGFWALECYQPDPPPGADEVERAAFWRRAGIDYIRQHKSRVPVVVAARVGRVWDLYRPKQNLDNSTLEGRNRRAGAVGQRVYFALLPLSVLGAIILRRRRVPILPLIAMAALVTLTAASAYGVIRFRVPAEVAMVILSAVAIEAALRSIIAGSRSQP